VTLRSLIDHYLERAEGADAHRRVERIPID
jgi:hypothetical protein